MSQLRLVLVSCLSTTLFIFWFTCFVLQFEYTFAGYATVFVLGVLLGTLGAVKEKNGLDMVFQWAFMTFTILGPILSYFFLFLITCSTFAPEWTGEATNFFACFHEGKIWLLPLVYWAMHSLYNLDVQQVETPNSFILGGLQMGAFVALVCTVHMGFYIGTVGDYYSLLIPAYLMAWYLWAMDRCAKKMGGYTWEGLTYGFLYSLPLWGVSVWQSFRVFNNLPSAPPADCYIVTAATRGHKVVVHPLFSVIRERGEIQVNAQLLTLWKFEAHWQLASPFTHKIFRKFYNTTGPHIAKHIRNPWVADVVYVCVKPVEWAARFILRRCASTQ